MSHPRTLDHRRSLLVVIDVQEAYSGLTVAHERMLRGVCRLIGAAKIVDVPILATEQYPKGLGHLMAPVREALGAEVQPVEKLALSCCGEPRFVERLEELGRQQVVVCGIETHACVNQTVHDLLARGYQVHVPSDATSARQEHDHRTGWEKMIGSGAVPSTVEMACLEWVRVAGSPQFKAVQKLIR